MTSAVLGLFPVHTCVTRFRTPHAHHPLPERALITLSLLNVRALAKGNSADVGCPPSPCFVPLCQVYVLNPFTTSNTTILTLRYKGTTDKPIYAVCLFRQVCGVYVPQVHLQEQANLMPQRRHKPDASRLFLQACLFMRSPFIKKRQPEN